VKRLRERMNEMNVEGERTKFRINRETLTLILQRRRERMSG
jgi:hypothetical protein